MFRESPKASARYRGYARALRRESTPHERLLWGLLRDRRFAAYKFRRQVPIGPFIVDFACFDAKLVVELDGSQHADDPRDAQRDRELARRGFRVLRVWNNQLTGDRDAVMGAVWAALQESGESGGD